MFLSALAHGISPCRGWWTNLTHIMNEDKHPYHHHPPFFAVVVEAVVHLVPNCGAIVLHVDQVPWQVNPLPRGMVSIHKYFVARSFPVFLFPRFVWQPYLQEMAKDKYRKTPQTHPIVKCYNLILFNISHSIQSFSTTIYKAFSNLKESYNYQNGMVRHLCTWQVPDS